MSGGSNEPVAPAADAGGSATAHPADDLLVPPGAETPPRLSVVMPTLDEAAAVGGAIDRAKDAIHDLGIPAEILISDSSTDRTPAIARERGAIVVTPDAPGYGAAYRHAFARIRGDLVVMGDADGTYDFGALPALLEPIVDGDADLVLGSRFAGEIEPGAMPALHRHVGNPLLTGFLNLFYDAAVTDAHTGFRALRREALEALSLRADGMEFASEMVMRASAAGLTISEVPITYHRREGEPTLDSFRDGWRHARFMLVNAPGYLFSGPGLLMAALGAALMAVSYPDLEVGGVDPHVHSMIAASLLVIVGAQVTSLGVFATVAGDPLKRPADPLTTLIADRTTLEYGATAGLVLVAAGGAYGVVALLRWVRSGFSQLPFLPADIVAFTAIVVGLQAVFSSFFMSVLADAE